MADTFSIDEAYDDTADDAKKKPDLNALDDVIDTALFLGSRFANAAAAVPGLPADLTALAARHVPRGIAGSIPVVGPAIQLEQLRQEREGPESMVPLGGQNIQEAWRSTGILPTPREPQNEFERYGGAVADFAGASAVPGVGMLSAASRAQKLGQVGGILGRVAERPGRFIAGETAAAVGGGIGSEAGADIGGDVGRGIGGIAGMVAPGGVTAAYRATGGMTGAAGRTGETVRTAKAFADIGTAPMTAQIAPHSGFGRIIERALSLIPGSSVVLSDRVIKQAEAAQNYVDSIVNLTLGAGRKSTEAAAGRTISEGIGQFITRFKAKSQTLYDEVDRHIPKGSFVGAGNLQQTLFDITARGQMTPELQSFIQSPMIQKLNAAFDEATAQSKTLMNQAMLPYQTIKDLRTAIGAKLEDAGQLADMPRGDLKRIYGALSDDMADAARMAGPDATKAFNRADRFYKAGRTRIDDTLEPIRRNRIDAEVFNALMNKDASRVAKVMSSLTRDQRAMVATEVFENLGRAKPGQQTAAGNVFSFETFLTNYDKLRADRTNGALFGGTPAIRGALDNLAKAAQASREAKKFLPNPSGTAQGILQYGAAGTVGMSLLSGLAGNAAAFGTAASMTLLAYVGPYISARMLTSPRFVNWLAKAAKTPLPRAPGHLARLSVIARSDPGLVREFMDNIEAGKGEEAASEGSFSVDDAYGPVEGQAAAGAAAAPQTQVNPKTAKPTALRPGQTVSGIMDGQKVTWRYRGGDPKEQSSWDRSPAVQ